MIKLDYYLFNSWPGALLNQRGHRGIAVERTIRMVEGRGGRPVPGRVRAQEKYTGVIEHKAKVAEYREEYVCKGEGEERAGAGIRGTQRNPSGFGIADIQSSATL